MGPEKKREEERLDTSGCKDPDPHWIRVKQLCGSGCVSSAPFFVSFKKNIFSPKIS